MFPPPPLLDHDAVKAEETTKNVRAEAEKMMEIPEEGDKEDDAQELCNCQLTLW